MTNTDALPITVRNVTKTYGPVFALDDVSLTEHNERFGTIRLTKGNPFGGWYGVHWPSAKQYKAPAFEMITDAKHVRDTLMNARRRAL